MTARTLARPIAIALLATGLLTAAHVFAADDGPLDAAHMSPAQKEFWDAKVSKMDPKGDGRVTAEGFNKYYADLWDKNVPPGKDALTVKELSEKWAMMETQNPLDPEFKTAVWREKHVATMDTDKDGTISRTEFLTHMQGHWEAASKLAHSPSLTHAQAMEVISNPLDPRYHVN